MSFTIMNKKTKKIIEVSEKDLINYPINEWQIFDKIPKTETR